MSLEEHRRHAVKLVRCAVITVSDTRTEATDSSGRLIRELLTAAGHEVCRQVIVPDEPVLLGEEIARLRGDAGCQAILVTGGTGVSPRDRTPEVIAGLIERRLEGFGELFRMLSFEEIGPAAMLSRAEAGVCGGQVIFCIPGSTHAVRLAMSRLILPELGHLVAELHKGP